MRRTIHVSGLSVLLALAYGSEHLHGQQSAPGAASGKTLFQQKCGFCHGPDGSGGEGPDLLHSSLVLHDKNGELIGPVVQGSRRDKGMPAFSLPGQQIRDLAAFLHQEIQAAATIFYTDSTSDYPIQKLLVGNADAGKAYFYGAGRCTTCHSPAGDLAHIAARYKPIDLQTRIAFPSGAVPTLVVTLPSGEKVSGLQVYSDRFLVSVRTTDGWIHTFQRERIKLEEQDPLAFHEKLLTTYTDKEIHDLFAYLETLK